MRLPMLIAVLVLFAGGSQASDGQRIFNGVCAACHSPDARGVLHIYPELHEHVACEARLPEGRAYLAGVLKHGLEGAITVEGDHIDGYMPMQPQLSAADKAAVLNYVVSLSARCAGPVEPFTAAEVEAALSDAKWNSESLHELREKLMESVPVSRADAPGSAAQSASIAQAAKDWALFCRGCHTPDGTGVPGSVPTLRRNVSLFASEAEGRAFLVRVPGVAFAPLDDARVANLLNWVIQTFSDTPLPESFTLYTGAEVAAYRHKPLVDVETARDHLLAELRMTGPRDTR